MAKRRSRTADLAAPFVVTVAASVVGCGGSSKGVAFTADPANAAECPDAQPAGAQPCELSSSTTCRYANEQAGIDATCTDGEWEVERFEKETSPPDPGPDITNPPPPPEECPVDPPSFDSSCFVPDGVSCEYGDCGGSPTTIATCDLGVWQVSEVSCNPPPIDPPIDPPVDPPPDGPAIVECADGDPTDAIDVLDASVDGDTLTIRIGHSAGCADHTYGLCYTSSWSPTRPSSVEVRVLHDDGGEMCEAYFEGELQFDLTPLQQAFIADNGVDSAVLSLGILDGLIYAFGAGTLGELEAVIDSMNSCTTVDDCVAVNVPPCDQRFVNASADVDGLQSAIDDWAAANGNDQLGCDLSCECGLLSCTAGKCVTDPGDCTSAPPGTSMICL